MMTVPHTGSTQLQFLDTCKITQRTLLLLQQLKQCSLTFWLWKIFVPIAIKVGLDKMLAFWSRIIQVSCT